jgi:hypothetical protein
VGVGGAHFRTALTTEYVEVILGQELVTRRTFDRTHVSQDRALRPLTPASSTLTKQTPVNFDTHSPPLVPPRGGGDGTDPRFGHGSQTTEPVQFLMSSDCIYPTLFWFLLNMWV